MTTKAARRKKKAIAQAEAAEKAAQKLGPTDKFPQGRINSNDKGEIRMSIFPDEESKVIIVEFGTKLSWIGMPPGQAREMGEALIRHANEMEGH